MKPGPIDIPRATVGTPPAAEVDMATSPLDVLLSPSLSPHGRFTAKSQMDGLLTPPQSPMQGRRRSGSLRLHSPLHITALQRAAGEVQHEIKHELERLEDIPRRGRAYSCPVVPAFPLRKLDSIVEDAQEVPPEAKAVPITTVTVTTVVTTTDADADADADKRAISPEPSATAAPLSPTPVPSSPLRFHRVDSTEEERDEREWERIMQQSTALLSPRSNGLRRGSLALPGATGGRRRAHTINGINL